VGDENTGGIHPPARGGLLSCTGGNWRRALHQDGASHFRVHRGLHRPCNRVWEPERDPMAKRPSLATGALGRYGHQVIRAIDPAAHTLYWHFTDHRATCCLLRSRRAPLPRPHRPILRDCVNHVPFCSAMTNPARRADLRYRRVMEPFVIRRHRFILVGIDMRSQKRQFSSPSSHCGGLAA
jgi:hypothetical protein